MRALNNEPVLLYLLVELSQVLLYLSVELRAPPVGCTIWGRSKLEKYGLTGEEGDTTWKLVEKGLDPQLMSDDELSPPGFHIWLIGTCDPGDDVNGSGIDTRTSFPGGIGIGGGRRAWAALDISGVIHEPPEQCGPYEAPEPAIAERVALQIGGKSSAEDETCDGTRSSCDRFIDLAESRTAFGDNDFGLGIPGETGEVGIDSGVGIPGETGEVGPNFVRVSCTSPSFALNRCCNCSSFAPSRSSFSNLAKSSVVWVPASVPDFCTPRFLQWVGASLTLLRPDGA